MSKSHKFKAKPTTYNGVRYDSKAEAARAQELDLMVRAREISWWIGQPKFRLGVPENVYVADFLVVGAPLTHEFNPNVWINVWIEDVKGRETAKFKRDKRLWARYGPCTLRIIKRKPKDGWSLEAIHPEGGRHVAPGI